MKHENDLLTIIFNKQRELQEKCFPGGVPRLGVPSKEKDLLTNLFRWQQYVNQQLLAIHEEAVEVMKETAYKSPDAAVYGYKKSQAVNLDNMKKELVDLLHFFINLCLAAEVTPVALAAAYLDKNAVNHARQDHGY